jgi:hypothetical protein
MEGFINLFSSYDISKRRQTKGQRHEAHLSRKDPLAGTASVEQVSNGLDVTVFAGLNKLITASSVSISEVCNAACTHSKMGLATSRPAPSKDA